MQKETDRTAMKWTDGRVLARVVAEDLRQVQGGGGKISPLTTATSTDAGLRADVTFRGGDGDSD